MKLALEQAVVTCDAARKLVGFALAEGEVRGLLVTATVVDPGMGLVCMAKADGATPHSVETSRRKANSSASTRRPTGWMTTELAGAIAPASGGALTNILGGVPITVDDTCVGGLGVAGGTPEQDAEVADAAARALLDAADGEPHGEGR